MIWWVKTTREPVLEPLARAAQGVFPPSSYEMLGLPGNWYGALEWQYPPHMRQGSYEEEGRAVNTLKARSARLL